MARVCIDQRLLGDRLREFHKAIGCSRNEAIGILINLWIWGCYNADESGNLKAADSKDIAEQIRIGMADDLDPDEVVYTLIKTGWLAEMDGEFRLELWDDLTGHFRKDERRRSLASERSQRYREKQGLKGSGKPETQNQDSPEIPDKKSYRQKQNEKYGDDFEKLWEIYPRKDRKGEAFKCYTARIKEGYAPDVIMSAAINYAEICKRERREPKYTLMARTFLGTNLGFTDYIPKQSPQAKQMPQDPNSNPFR